MTENTPSSPPPLPPASARSGTGKFLHIFLIVTQAIYALALLPWASFSLFSVMAFDKPGSEHDPSVWAFVLTLWAFPVVAIICSAGAWIFRRTKVWAIVLTLLPALYAIGWFVGFTFATSP